jgi:hypothetical protein
VSKRRAVGRSSDGSLMTQANQHRAETLEYIESMLQQLSIMARAEHLDMLVYFVEMACVECSDALRDEKMRTLSIQQRNSAA